MFRTNIFPELWSCKWSASKKIFRIGTLQKLLLKNTELVRNCEADDFVLFAIVGAKQVARQFCDKMTEDQERVAYAKRKREAENQEGGNQGENADGREN
jgi:DNA-binding ferritin-like protein (Dps family)